MNVSERVLILAPQGRDAAVAAALLREAGKEALVCASIAELASELDKGAGAAIIVDEAIERGRMDPVSEWIEQQPAWSDLPFVFLTQRGGGPERNPFLSRVNEVLGNVIFLERPFHPTSLVTAIENALRARRRQYQARATMDRVASDEKRLAIALQAGRQGAWSLDLTTMTLDASPQCKANFGRGPDDAFSYDDLQGSLHPHDLVRMRTAVFDAMASRQDYAIEFRAIWPDGTLHWVDMRGAVMPDRYNRLLTMAGVSSDITARKALEEERERLLAALAVEREHTQEALRGEKAFSSLLMSSVPAGIVAYDLDLNITTWNPVMERLVGLDAEAVAGRPLFEVIAADRVPAMEPRVRAALSGTGGPMEEMEFPTEQGQVWLETQHAPLHGGDGTIIGGVAFFRDVTERRQAEEQLRQAQKMETMGQLTGGVAHDFNNLLAAVLGNLELLKKKLPDDPQLSRHIDGAMQGAQRGAALTQRLLAFARRQDLQPEAVDLGDLIEGMRGLMERSLGPMIAIEIKLAEVRLPPAKVDPNQLELALLNLAVNARDAMPEGGRLTIRLDQPRPPADLGLSGDFVRISVEDTGTGMDEDTLKRAIEPFFSTKEIGKGTGLGLSMVHGLAVQLGGALQIKSEPGSGTTIELWLPVSSVPVAEAAPKAAEVAPAPSANILVVDDDALIAMNTVDMVTDLGHTVLEAYSGREALDILERGTPVDAIITDYAMPGMTGVELAEKARLLRPDLPILLATGYADLPSGTTTDLPRLGKPYQQRDLSERLGKLLSGRVKAEVK